MKFFGRLLCLVVAGLCSVSMASGDETVFDDFENEAQDRWTYIADGVMGGVSNGEAIIGIIDGAAGIRLTGEVSTKNNGGFIQVRRTLSDGLPAQTAGIELDVRGNGETYFVFIRTAEMTRPWYYYNAEFTTDASWQTVTIPLDQFERSHAHLMEKINPSDVISIGIFAYGRDYVADVMVHEIRLY